ncbi:dephospho-CoA kinase [Corynebacterium diphtheriae]|nr:dephospho-CoA kinase [Corynebacterium diphtheriae]CAB1035645.1 dephospho-CoA kinase [Corynebacterium diphtheriae]
MKAVGYSTSMRIIGLTGGIGSGKSTVARIWQGCGAIVIDADAIARVLMEPGSTVLEEVSQAFGRDLLDAEGKLRRAELAARAFISEGKTAQLNSITHPAIRRQIVRGIERARVEGVQVLVLDHPLLLESGMSDLVDDVVVVDVPVELRVRRLVNWRGLKEEDARHRIRRQMSDEDRRMKADYVIDNSGSRDVLERLARELWQRFATQVG